jgi:hypothetical protein
MNRLVGDPNWATPQYTRFAILATLGRLASHRNGASANGKEQPSESLFCPERAVAQVSEESVPGTSKQGLNGLHLRLTGCSARPRILPLFASMRPSLRLMGQRCRGSRLLQCIWLHGSGGAGLPDACAPRSRLSFTRARWVERQRRRLTVTMLRDHGLRRRLARSGRSCDARRGDGKGVSPRGAAGG